MDAHSPSESAAVPAAPGRSLLRALRVLLWIGLGVFLALVVALAVAQIYLGGEIATGVAVLGAVAALVLTLRRLPFNAWTRLGVSYALLGGVVTYLVVDDATVVRPAMLEARAPKGSDAAQSFELFMQYGKRHPLGRDFKFQSVLKPQQGTSGWKPRDPQWSAWLTTNRAALERGWVQLEPVRTWWNELNAFDQIGDLTPAGMDAEIIAFQPIRALYQHACAIASLQALTGDGDGAMATLAPILEVSRKLEPSSRTLVRTMIALAARKLAIETATFVLDTTTISPVGRARLAAAIAGEIPAEQGVRRLMAAEYESAVALLTMPSNHQILLGEMTPAWVRTCVQPFGRLIVNPRRTVNLYAELTTELQDRASRRETNDIDGEAQRFIERHRVALKNLGGSQLMAWMTPTYKKVVETYWTTEDLRLALRGRLQS